MSRHVLKRAWLVCCFAIVLLPVAGAPGPGAAAAAAATAQTTLDGTFRTLALMPVAGQTAARHDIPVLDVGDTEYELELPPGTSPSNGAQVRVTGELTGRTGVVGSEILAVSTVAPLAGVAAALALPPTSGTARVLVMLVQWTGAGDSVTPASAATQIFTDDKNWYVENSYAQLTLSGSVTNLLSIPAPTTACNTNDIMNNAKAAATTAGFTLSNFDITMAYFPSTSACEFAGLAQIGAGATWINGSMTRRVTVHEMGHNIGLFHAHSYPCRDASSNQLVLDDPNQCAFDEYGDPFDAMGSSSLVGHFSAYQKDLLGWLGGSRVATLTTGGSATLPPIENTTAGTLVARINVSATRTYWLEYRQAIGFDSSLPSGAIDGVLVHMYDSTVVSGGPELLDMRPGPGTTVDFANAALPFNTVWKSPDNWQITVGAQGPSGVLVSVQLLSNDNLANALMVTGEAVSTTGSNTTATKEAGEPNHAGVAGTHSVWYRWTAAAAGVATVDTTASGFDTLLGIYTGTAVNALTQIASNDNDPGGGVTSKATFTAVGGTTYKIAVDGSGAASGSYALHLNLVLAPPPNDNFAARQTVSGTSGSSTAVRTTNATKEPGEPNHAGNAGGRSAWYRWTAPSAGNATFDTVGSNYNTLLGIYTGSAVNALATIASNDNSPAGGNTSKATFVATSGTVYMVAVDGSGGASGTAKLNWSLVPGPPANDDFVNAQVMAGPIGQSTPVATASATKESGEPNHAGNPGGKSVWYRWTPTRGGTATIDTVGSNFDTILGVYTGAAVNALTTIASNDDDPAIGVGVTSTVTFTAVAGTTYRVAVDGYNSLSGTVVVRWKLPGGAPADFNGSGTTDLSVFRPSNGAWYVQNQSGAVFGTTGDIPVPGDYDGNGTTDFAVFRPGNGAWYVQNQSGAVFGTTGDIPVPGDYDGNGTTDFAVYRPSTGAWYIQGQPGAVFGAAGDIPVPGDYDGNGTTDIAVFRPSNGGWYILGQAGSVYGASGDIPVPGDYNGNGTTDLAVFRPSNGGWYILGQSGALFGGSGDRPLPLPSAIRQVFFP